MHWRHGSPATGPPMQRLPPQMPASPPLTGQSAFSAHPLRVKVLHVSQRHLRVVKPVARHWGLAALTVRVCSPVAMFRSIPRMATTDPEGGGQSRLVGPKRLEPFTTHAWPL